MTSSVQNLSGSDNDEADEQHSHSESQIKSPCQVIGMSHPAVTAPGMQYVAPTQIGPRNCLGVSLHAARVRISLSRSTRTSGSPGFDVCASRIEVDHLPETNNVAQAAYPYPDPYYRSIFAPYDAQAYPAQPYPAQPMVHLQFVGIQQAGVPLPSDVVEEPVFVNAKQYHGILRRRQSRAKAESENKALKSRKPYLHESRHLHALRRARGTGGRFLNSKKNENKTKEAESGDKLQSNINLNAQKNDLPSESAS